MILSTHLLTGAALGANIQNPIAVAVISVALHFSLDILPHGDYLNRKSKITEFWKVAVDLAVGFSLVFAIAPIRGETSNNIAIGIFFSLLPDGLTFCYWKLKMKFLAPIYHFHQSLHRFENGSPKRKFGFHNNIWDILISFVSIIVLIFLR